MTNLGSNKTSTVMRENTFLRYIEMSNLKNTLMLNLHIQVNVGSTLFDFWNAVFKQNDKSKICLFSFHTYQR